MNLKKVSIIVDTLGTTAWNVAEALTRYDAVVQEERANSAAPQPVADPGGDEADQAADGTFAAQLADLQSRLEDMASASQAELAQLADMVAARIAAAEATYARPRHPYENVERDYEADGE